MRLRTRQTSTYTIAPPRDSYMNAHPLGRIAACETRRLFGAPAPEDGHVVSLCEDVCRDPFFLVHAIEIVEEVARNPLELVGADRVVEPKWEVRGRAHMQGPVTLKALSKLPASFFPAVPKGCRVAMDVTNIDACDHYPVITLLLEHD